MITVLYVDLKFLSCVFCACNCKDVRCALPNRRESIFGYAVNIRESIAGVIYFSVVFPADKDIITESERTVWQSCGGVAVRADIIHTALGIFTAADKFLGVIYGQI